MSEPLIRVEGVAKKFCRSLKKSLWYGLQDIGREIAGNRTGSRQLRSEEFWAINDISFELRRGECLGLIGRNGAGKTTLLKMLNGLIKPDAGRITMRGQIGAMIALGAGFNPVLTGRENIFVNGAVLGLSKRAIAAKLEDIVEFAELGEFIDAPVQSYSSGMQVRLGFSVATALQPDVLLLDEVLAVGDTAFRNKCYRRVSAMRKQAAVIFVSHNMEQVARICDRALVMSKGEAACLGNVAEGVEAYGALNGAGEDRDQGFLSFNAPISGFSAVIDETAIESSSALGITVQITSREPVEDFRFRVQFYNPAGASAADGMLCSPADGLRLARGGNTWKLTLPSLPLRQGRYRISLAVIDRQGDVIVWSHKQHEVTVRHWNPGAISDCQLALHLSEPCLST